MLEFLTPAAMRAWEQARLLARESQSEEVEPLHLLWALVLDESRASQTLQDFGISAESLHQSHPLSPPLPEDLAWEQRDQDDASGVSHHSLPDAGDQVRMVFHEARRLAGPFSGAVEVGTEHLLAALAEVESPVATLLKDAGWWTTPDDPRRAIAPSPAAEPTETPLVADEALVIAGPRVTDEIDGLRMVDAAANRAREGLRVLEDYARFACDDRFMAESLKHWRHEFAQLMARYGEYGLLSARDTEGDVGTDVRTRHETTRECLLDVVRAAFKRTEEAARTLEEVSKTLRTDLAEPLGQLRYRLYTLEKSLLRTVEARQRLAGRSLYLLLTDELCHHGSGPAVKEALAGGVGIVQIREKGWSDRRLLDHARRVRTWTASSDALLIMNDRPDLAVLAEADGVHVGQDDLPVREARRIVGPNRLVGVSTHTIEQARQAVIDGADYIGVGPMFPSTTKSFAEYAGLEFLKQVASEIRLPAYAIGGIAPNRMAELIGAGARGVAVSSAICSSPEPLEAARTLRAFLP